MKRTFLIGIAGLSLAACTQEPIEVSAQPKTTGANLIAAEAKRQGVPVDLALRVAKVESGHRCNAIGPATSVGRGQGPLQIMPSSARGLGHRGGSLNNCGAGLHYGMKHLAVCWRGANGNKALAAHCHNAGFGVLKRGSAPRTRYVQLVLNGR